MAGERIRAILLLKKAMKASENKEGYDQSCQLIDQGIVLLNRCRPGRQTNVDLAKAHQAGGQIRLEHGKLEPGFEWFAKAEDLFSEHDPEGEDHGRCLIEMAMMFYDVNMNPVALEYLRRAFSILERYGEPYVTDLPPMLRRLAIDADESGHWDDDKYAEFLDAWRRAKPGEQRARAGQDLAMYLLHSEQASAHLAELHASLHDALQWPLGIDDLENSLAALSAFVDMYWAGATLPPWATDAAHGVLNLARARGSLGDQALACTLCAVALASDGRVSEAIGQALTAAALHDAHLVSTESSLLRMLASHDSHTAREIAVDLAVKVNDAALVIELLESSRLQVLPTVTRNTHRAATVMNSKSIAGRFVGFAGSKLTPPRPISAGGFSQLASRYPPNAVGPPIAMEEVIEAIGGVGACWWGGWVFNGRIYWAFMEEGRPSCGVINLATTAGLEDVLMTALSESLLDPGASTPSVLAGPWCRTSGAEADLSAILGDHLIPPPLRTRLSRASINDPVSLVLAGNLFGMLPAPLLAAGPREGFADRKRLLELAVIRIAPPAVLVERARQHPLYPAEIRAIAVACVDPQSNLPNAGRIPDGSVRVLSGTNQNGQIATHDALVEALRATPMSIPALFYFSGHSSNGGLGGDIEDGLALHDSSLSAREVFTIDDFGQPTIPFPDRALLSACELAGSRGAGAGEWLGLTAAILWAGARQVISTHWEIWDTRFTSDFDMELAHNLRSTTDPAVTLRRIQLEYLEMWRLSLHDFSGQGLEGIPFRYERTPFPLIWAAYCCAGIIE